MGDLIGLAEAAAVYGRSRFLLQEACQCDEIEGARKIGGQWFLPAVPGEYVPAGAVVSGQQAAKELGVGSVRMTVLCQTGRIAGARKVGNVWLIPTPVVRLPPQPPARDGCLSPKEAAAELGLQPRRVRALAQQGLLVGARMDGKRWRIPTPVVRV